MNYIEPIAKTETEAELKVPVEVYSRIVGYFRPINQWNQGKQKEFHHRALIDIDKALKTVVPENEYNKGEVNCIAK